MFDDITVEIPGSFSSLFKRKKTKCVGVDVGNSSIKIVELEKKNGKIVLKNYALTKVEKKDLIKPGSSKVVDPKVGDIVEKILDDIGVKTKDVNVAIPSFASLTTTIELPPVSEKEIEQIIQVEAPKYIPVPLEEVVYGWEIINDKSKKSDQEVDPKLLKASGKKMLKVVLVSIMKNISKEYEKIFETNGYDVDSLEVDTFALRRSVIGDENKNYLMVDIGNDITNISVVSNGGVVINRSIDVGGKRLTDLLATAMGVSSERAEKTKISQGLEIDSHDIKNQVLIPLVKNITDEINKAIEVFDENYPDKEIDSLILTGGLSQLKGIKDFFEKELKIKITEGKVWSKVEYPQELKKSLDSLNPYFGVAVGLALRGLMDE